MTTLLIKFPCIQKHIIPSVRRNNSTLYISNHVSKKCRVRNRTKTWIVKVLTVNFNENAPEKEETWSNLRSNSPFAELILCVWFFFFKLAGKRYLFKPHKGESEGKEAIPFRETAWENVIKILSDSIQLFSLSNISGRYKLNKSVSLGKRLAKNLNPERSGFLKAANQTCFFRQTSLVMQQSSSKKEGEGKLVACLL